jgi:two-component sensor histidine kinase
LKNNLQVQIDLQRRDIAKILSWAYRLLPIGYGLIIVIRTITGGWITVLTMLGAIMTIPIANSFLKKGKIETSLLILIISLVIPLDIAVTFGNGIHDVGILAFPVILLISSLMIHKWQQIFSFILIMLSIMWLALGEYYGYYKPNPDISPAISELIITLVIVTISAMICYQIATNLKKALKKRDKEVLLTATKLDLLTKSLNLKIKLTNAVHLQVIDSISIIRELLGNQKDQPLKHLPNQLLAMELVHAELYRLELEKELDLENYLDVLFGSQVENFDELKKIRFDEIMINVDQALSIGIFFTELSLNNSLVGSLEVEKADKEVSIKVNSPNLPFLITVLAEIMVRQLNGQLVHSEKALQLSFTLKSGQEE